MRDDATWVYRNKNTPRPLEGLCVVERGAGVEDFTEHFQCAMCFAFSRTLLVFSNFVWMLGWGWDGGHGAPI